MAKKKLSEDEIRWILSVDSDGAQQGIHKLTKENKELNRVNKERSALLRQLEAEGKKESKSYKNLEAEIESASQTISKNNQKISELEKKLDVTGLTMSQLRKKARDLRHQLDSTVKATHPEEYAALEKELSRVNNRMDELRGSGKNIKQEFDVCERGLSKLKAVAVAFITVKLAGYLKDIGRKAYETRKEFAKYEAVLKNALQSQEKAAKAMKMLQKLAAETPASLKIWTEGFIKLVNRGINPTKDELTNMGDLASSQGKSIDQLIEAILDAMTGENERLKEFGIRASKNGDKVKYTFRGITTEVNNSEESIKNYLLSLGKLEGVADSMAIQMKELEGMQSNLGDTMDAIYNKIGKKFEPMIKSVMGSIGKLLGDVSNSLDTASEAYDRQREKTIALETTMPGLLSKYEELTSKTSLSKDEHEELGGIIKRITTMVPGAVTAFDQYGTAISISTDKVRSFIEEQKTLLKFQNRQAIKDTEELIEEYKKKMTELQKAYDQGGKTVSHSTGFSGTMYSAPISYVDKNTMGEIEQELKGYGDLLKGAELDLERLRGDSLEKAVEDQQNQLEARNRFNNMNKSMLDAWLKDEKNAADKYREIAEEIYKKRFPTITPTSKDKSDPNAVALKNMESAHAAEINEIRLSGQEKQQAEADINLAILQADQAYYTERISQLEKFKANEKKASRQADYQKQIVDSKSRLIETELSMEKQRIAAIEKLRQEDLTKEEAVTKSLQIHYTNELAGKHITQEQYEMLMLSLTSSSAEMRYAIEERYLNDINDLELKNGKLKADAVKQANDAVLTAEQNAANARAALQVKMNDLVKDFKSQFKLTTVDEDLEAQIKVLDAAYAARKEIAEKQNLDTSELDAAHERAKENLVRDSEYRINQIRNQYGLLTQKGQFDLELQQLKEHQDAEIISHEEYEKAVQNLKRDSYKKQFDYYSGLFSGAVNALQEAEMSNVDAKYDAEIEAAQGNAEEVERLEKEKAQKKLDIEKKYADINFAIKASQIIADTAVSIMKAIADLGPIAGPIAAALMGITGAAQLANANAERKKVKNMTLSGTGSSSKMTRVAVGRESGGKIDITRAQDGKLFLNTTYDPDKRGFVDKPTVIVGEGPAGKSKEWIASNDAVTNPTIAPFLNVLDRAQQAGTIRTLDLNKVIQARMAGFAAGGSITPQPVNTPSQLSPASDDNMSDALVRFCNIMDRLEEEGLPAYTLLDEYDKARKLQQRSRKIGSKS